MTETKTTTDMILELSKAFEDMMKAKENVKNIMPSTTPVSNDQKESVKLVKNTKGYNWEIKLRDDEITGETLNRLQAIDKNLQYKFTQK